MDFNNMPNNDRSQPPQDSSVPPHEPVSHNIPDFNAGLYEPYPKKKKGSGWKIFWGIVITLSLLANGVMFISIIGMIAMRSMGSMFSTVSSASVEDNLNEKTLIEGSRNKTIAVINIRGIINDEMSDWVRRQVETAENDDNVRALIVRIVSPGGAVSSSDQIYHYITQFKDHTHKPVLGFMQSVAASGGYYSAVACDQIMAEPTVITGSIGVIMNYMVIKGLLEEKLGINPVTIKSGEHKDWPSMFNEATDEQKKYLDDKLITPAYNRFVELVAEGRKDVLSEPEIRALADGSIYSAPEALQKKLIDDIGYFDDAVYKAEQMAKISDAHVVEYEEVFSFWNMLGAQGKTKINIETEILEHIAAPRLLYLWDGKE